MFDKPFMQLHQIWNFGALGDELLDFTFQVEVKVQGHDQSKCDCEVIVIVG